MRILNNYINLIIVNIADFIVLTVLTNHSVIKEINMLKKTTIKIINKKTIKILFLIVCDLLICKNTIILLILIYLSIKLCWWSITTERRKFSVYYCYIWNKLLRNNIISCCFKSYWIWIRTLINKLNIFIADL